MQNAELLLNLDFAEIDTLVFAGGGNRCWWQAGAISQLLQQGARLPAQLVGTSAGAAVAASCITDGPKAALASCVRLYADHQRIFDWRGLARLKLRFAHQHIYPAWVASIVHAGNFDALRSARTQLRVAFTRPARLLGLTGSIAAGTLAYVVDKHLWHSIHPRLPKLFGLRQDFLDLHQCQSVADAQALLSAAAAAPPLMASRQIGAQRAFDGGYTDNAPIHPQTPAQKSSTLVLLTRFYPHLPVLFRWGGRAYWQPSRPVPVSTWDCTARTTVHEAFAHGEGDAVKMFQGGVLTVSG